MNFFRILIAIISFAISLSCAAAQSDNLKGNNLLKYLAFQLSVAHMAPQGADYGFRCPKNSEHLLEMSKASVEGSLGKPNHAINRSGAIWTYYFSSTPPNDWQPRYPRLTFYFGPKQKIKRVTCFDFS